MDKPKYNAVQKRFIKVFSATPQNHEEVFVDRVLKFLADVHEVPEYCEQMFEDWCSTGSDETMSEKDALKRNIDNMKAGKYNKGE